MIPQHLDDSSDLSHIAHGAATFANSPSLSVQLSRRFVGKVVCVEFISNCSPFEGRLERVLEQEGGYSLDFGTHIINYQSVQSTGLSNNHR